MKMLLLMMCIIKVVSGQQRGSNYPEVHPPLPMVDCSSGTCKEEATSVVLDENWRWVHGIPGYTNCYTGTEWNKKFCPDPVTCAKNCALEGVNYAETYEITTSGTELTLGYVAPGGNVGSRTYLMDPVPPPVKHNYTHYEHKNCYSGHGGTDIDTKGVPNLSVAQCTKRCDADSVCSCVTFQPSNGMCWKRGACVPSGFLDDNGYDVYVKDPLPSVEDNDPKYKMFKLKNREFSFDVDVSTLVCGLNGALYFVEMDADGGMSRFPGNNAGAAYGTGYCDAQCPNDVKFINGEANILDWNTTIAKGRYGSCCTEMDIWEANMISNALTPHPCTVDGQTRCNGTDCGHGSDRLKGFCDESGCDFNPWRVGIHNFYGPGSNFTIDTTKPLTVATSFVTTDGTDTGDLKEITRYFVQNGKKVPFPNAPLVDKSANSITDDFCAKSKTAFKDPNDFKTKGGLKRVSEALDHGMVLVMSLWDDTAAHMLWLDSSYPLDRAFSDPGVSRGSCVTTSGVPEEVRKNNPKAYVKFSNIKLGPISK